MLRKHSLTIAGHATSLTLEPVFWDALRVAAAADGKPLAALVAEIDEARTSNLSSAVRVWLFERAQRAAARANADLELDPLGIAAVDDDIGAGGIG